ncbi:hypothetical protein CBR_g460 [Chara braunii]|uniref:Uncharacterized protein n=1 Tax=Chara braunii TaxID=69332 RepID=A0A388KBB9_CHABU|nr:hypothetical protein CBR_g460 [Chara braunii]|eukprot:GBG67321.1 hypothetical protein CBR_g460 [Chara braunii]
MASLGELEANEWLTIVQVGKKRVCYEVAKLKAVTAETTVPSIPWTRSVQEQLLETAWGLEEVPPPHLRALIDGPRLGSLMRNFYEDLEEGQDLCAEQEDRCYEDDINSVADDVVDIDSMDNGDLTCTTVLANNIDDSKDIGDFIRGVVCYNNNNRDNNNNNKSSNYRCSSDVASAGVVNNNQNSDDNVSAGGNDNNTSDNDYGNNNNTNNHYNTSEEGELRACFQDNRGVSNEGDNIEFDGGMTFVVFEKGELAGVGSSLGMLMMIWGSPTARNSIQLFSWDPGGDRGEGSRVG